MDVAGLSVLCGLDEASSLWSAGKLCEHRTRTKYRDGEMPAGRGSSQESMGLITGGRAQARGATRGKEGICGGKGVTSPRRCVTFPVDAPNN